MLLTAAIAASAALAVTACTASVDPAPSSEESSVSEATRDLLSAAESGDADALKTALDAGADIDARGSGGMTALVTATKANSVDAARILIEAGADVNA